MAQVVLNRVGLQRLLVDPAGPVMRNMALRGERVASLAKVYAAQAEHTGVLANSIIAVVVPGPVSVVRVGSTVEYALYVHEGTGPQHITSDGALGSVPDPRARYLPPMNKPGFIVWSADHGWPLNQQGHAWQLAKYISFYGTKPHPYLRGALSAAA